MGGVGWISGGGGGERFGAGGSACKKHRRGKGVDACHSVCICLIAGGGVTVSTYIGTHAVHLHLCAL